MGAEGGLIELVFRAKLDALEKDMATGKTKAGQAAADMGEEIDSKLGSKLAGVGATVSKALLPVGLALTGTAALIGNAWRGATNDIKTTTGATGDELTALEGSLQKVAGTVKGGGLATVADVMGDIAVKTHLTGTPLEDLTRRLLELRDIGREVSVADVGGAFGKWSVPTGQWADELDRLFRISQETGVSLPTLLGRLAEFEPVLKALGYNFDQASLLAARLPDTVLPALKAALVDASAAQASLADNQLKAEAAQVSYTTAVDKHGESSLQARTAAADLAAAEGLVALGSKDVAAAFADQVASVRDAATDQDALALSMEAFGAKGGLAMRDAIRGGKFEVDALSDSVAANTTTIHAAAQDQITMIDRLGMLKDKAVALAGPLADTATKYSGLATGAVSVYKTGAKLVGMWTAHFGAATLAAGATDALALSEGAEGAVAAAATGPTLGFAAGLWAVAAPVLAVIAVIALLVAAGYLLITHWDEVKAGAARVWGWIQGAIGGAVDWITGKWSDLKAGAGEAWDWVERKISGVVDFIVGIPDRVAGALDNVWDGLLAGFRYAWNDVASTINSADFTFPSGIPFIGGKTIGLPDLPILDSGGIVNRPTLAMLAANSRPEAVVPLDDYGGFAGGGTGAGGGGERPIIIQAKALLGTKAEIKRWIREAMDDTGRANGSTGF